jgi:hypothetical protein
MRWSTGGNAYIIDDPDHYFVVTPFDSRRGTVMADKEIAEKIRIWDLELIVEAAISPIPPKVRIKRGGITILEMTPEEATDLGLRLRSAAEAAR